MKPSKAYFLWGVVLIKTIHWLKTQLFLYSYEMNLCFGQKKPFLAEFFGIAVNQLAADMNFIEC